jgi:hypothetical protein
VKKITAMRKKITARLFILGPLYPLTVCEPHGVDLPVGRKKNRQNSYLNKLKNTPPDGVGI